MKRCAIIVSISLCLILSSVCHANDSYRDGYLLVKFSTTGTSSVSQSTRQAVVTAAGGGTIEKMYPVVPGLGLVKLPSGADVATAKATFASTAGVVYAEPDYIGHYAAVPNDTYFNLLWGMDNQGQTGGVKDADIDAPEAWDISTGSKEIIVAICDSGIDYTHPDLANNMWVNEAEKNGVAGVDDDNNGYIDDIYGYDFAGGDSDPEDNVEHGTHVSGTVGAVGNNGLGVAGVNWNVRLMACKIGDTYGIPISAAIEGIEYAINMGAKVMNHSWGGYTYSQALYDTIQASQEAGLLFVAAAGNEYNDNDALPAYPASYDLDNIISVVATDDSDVKANFSNWGKTTTDLAAPGVNIYSTQPGGGYQYMSGTSMASPHVAGAAAFVWSVNPALTAAEVKQVLLDSVDKKSALQSLCVSGGRLNLHEAALLAEGGDLLPPLPDPETFLIKASATGLTTIVAQAVKATDKSGVQYYFECVENHAYDSGWQDSPLYLRSDYAQGTTYTFRVKARDKSENLNETDYSEPVSTTTATGIDNLPPAPNPTLWKANPRVTRPSLNEIGMEVVTSYDENGVEYYFDCVFASDGVDPNTYDSGWQTSPVYNVRVSQVVGQEYTFMAYARQQGTTDPIYVTEASVAMKAGKAASSIVREVPSAAYRTIQDAVDAANNGDTVLVHPGVYREVNIDFKGKAITVRSENPEDAAVVAATVIDCQEIQQLWIHEARRAFLFQNMEGRNSVLAGLTIRNATAFDEAATRSGPIGWQGDPDQGNRYTGLEGADGTDALGGAIVIGSAFLPSSPTIRNCVFENCSANGEYGPLNSNAPGVNIGPGNHGDRGLNGGNAYGGAIYTYTGSAPLLKACEFSNCQAVGGNGSNGSNGSGGGGHLDSVENEDGWRGGEGGDGGLGGCAWGGAIYFESGCSPELYGVSVSDCFVQIGQPGRGGNGGSGSDAKGIGVGGNGGNGGVGGDLRAPDSSGGAIYYGDNTTATIDGCVFDNCFVIAELTGDYSGGNGGNGGNAAGDGQTGGNGGHGGPAYFIPDKMFELGGATATGGTGGNGGNGSNGGGRGAGGNGGFRFGAGGSGQGNGATYNDTGIFPSNIYYMAYYWEDTANSVTPPSDPNLLLDNAFIWTDPEVVELTMDYLTNPNDPNTFVDTYIRLRAQMSLMFYSPYAPYYGMVSARLDVDPTLTVESDPNTGNPILIADYSQLVTVSDIVTDVVPLTPTNPAQPNAGACAGANFYGANSVITMRDTVVSNNTSFANQGGGELYDKGCEATFDTCTFEGNRTLYDTLIATDYKFEGYGGAIFADQPVKMTFTDCEFNNNEAYGGAGIYCNFGPSDPNYQPELAFTQSVFSGNRADYHFMNSYGGAVYAGNSLHPYEEYYFNFLLNSTDEETFITSLYPDEHGEYRPFFPMITSLWNDEVEADHILNGAQSPQYDVHVTDCTFEENLAAYGAGVYFDASKVALTGSQFLTNTGQGGAGGFVYGCDINAANNTFAYNVGHEIQSVGYLSEADNSTISALGTSPALYVSNSDSFIINNHFAANETDGYGGALYINGLSLSGYPQSVFNNLFVENKAGLGGGALIADGGTDVEVMNCTFVENEVQDNYGYGGAIIAHDAYMSITNTILYNNEAALGLQLSVGDPLEVLQVYDPAYIPATTVYVDYSDIQGGIDDIFIDENGWPWLEYGANNIEDIPVDGNDPEAVDVDEADPQFIAVVDPNTAVDRTFYLADATGGQVTTSPCLDHGTPDHYLYDPSTGDFEYVPNVVDWLEAKLGFPITTRADHTAADSAPIDMGYHYNQSLPINEYVLTAGVYVADLLRHGELTVGRAPLAEPELVDAASTTYQYRFNQGTVVKLNASPDDMYRVARWLGTDDDTAQHLVADPNNNTITLSGNRISKVEFELAEARKLYVPETYDSIEDALVAARSGDTIVLAPRPDSPYLIENPDGLNFGVDKNGHPKNLVITSTDPDDPDVVASTIIDCQGSRYVSKRAFHFDSGQDPTSRIEGITIRNAFTAEIGLSAAIPTGRWPWWDGAAYWYNGNPIQAWDEAQPNPNPLPPIRGFSGMDATGDSYGGAILCENNSSPLIRKCVFEKCTVSGGIGGDGEDGLYPPNMQTDADLDSQSGGHSGMGSGDGFGGAIAIVGGSSPILEECTFKDNRATGGWGGIPGDAGRSYNNGRYGWGGNDPAGVDWAIQNGYPINPQAGDGEGDGHGGAIYVAAGCAPRIDQCTFVGNYARPGYVSAGGAEGLGKAYPQPFDAGTMGAMGLTWGAQGARVGMDGYLTTYGTIAGGAMYFEEGADVLLEGCRFESNEAYEVHTYDDPAVTTRGGGIYADPNAILTIDGSEFTSNIGGALYCSTGVVLNVRQTAFTNNSSYYPIPDPTFVESYLLSQTADEPVGLYDIAGGITLEVDAAVPADVNDCQFYGNQSHVGGGAIRTYSDLILENSVLNGNRSLDNGGAIYSYYQIPSPNTHTISMLLDNCEFSGNDAKGLGGAGFLKNNLVEIDDSYFTSNTAFSGGALRVSASESLTISGSLLYGNEATGVIAGTHRTVTEEGFGGGLHVTDTPFSIENTRFEKNRADGIISSGGGLCITGSQTYYNQSLRNCLFADNHADNSGGAVSCQSYVDLMTNGDRIVNCTFANNSSGNDLGGAFYVDHLSKINLTRSIVSGNTGIGIYESEDGSTVGDSTASYCLFYGNVGGDMRDSVDKKVIPATSAPGYASGTILVGNPMFVTAPGPFGMYYLNQTSSPAVDPFGDVSSYPTALGAGLSGFTTDSAGMLDVPGSKVDLGYHYNDPRGIPEFTLTTAVQLKTVDEAGNEITTVVSDAGKIVPGSGTYRRGAVLNLTADINKEYFLLDWAGGTFNDNSPERTNSVLMFGGNKTITAQVRMRETLNVGASSEYNTLGDAIDAAQDGDVILVAPGVYTAASQFPTLTNTILLDGKKLTISGSNPSDEGVVRATVFRESQFMLSNLDSDTVVEGIMLENSNMNLIRSDIILRNCIFSDCTFTKGQETHNNPPAGTDGYHQYPIVGGALAMMESSPQVTNCTFENNWVQGADGENGTAGGQSHPTGGDGGWPSPTYGGAVYCGLSSSPTFAGCTFTGNEVFGANGGNGANGWVNNGTVYNGGRGGGWMYADSVEQYLIEYGQLVATDYWDGWVFNSYGDKYTSYSLYADFYGEYDFDLWAKWFNWSDTIANWDAFFAAYNSDPADPFGDPYDQMMDVWRYSGYGGAVYCEFNSDAQFNDCVFDNNQSHGGLTGVGGYILGETSRPDRQLNMPTGGGAVFAAHDSDLTFENCVFNNNVADTSTVDVPDTFQVSFGGAVGYEFNCAVTFNDCVLSANNATVGGGIYGYDSMTTVADCNILDNESFLGAGVYLDDQKADITRTLVHGNYAKAPEVVGTTTTIDQTGQGGGIYAHVLDLTIRDSKFYENQSQISGGGLMLSGTVDATSKIDNCLFVKNRATNDGGGASASWFSKAAFTNCTFADNSSLGSDVSGYTGSGGGLYCGYDSKVDVLDSVFWGNGANVGYQIAVTGDEVVDGVSERPSELTITYTNVTGYPGSNALYVAPGCTSDDSHILRNSFTDPADAFVTLPSAAANDVSAQYYLDQTNSPWKDAGSRTSFEAGLNTYTTSIYGARDRGTVDLGYHYLVSVRSDCGTVDEALALDGIIDLSDLASFLVKWLDKTCSAGDGWCSGSDLNFDGEVNFDDLAGLSVCWLEEDKAAPEPNPAEWKIEPRAIPDMIGEIEMAAVVHHDAWWPDVWGMGPTDSLRYRFYFTDPEAENPDKLNILYVNEDTGGNNGQPDGWLTYNELTDDSKDVDGQTVLQIYAHKTGLNPSINYEIYLQVADGSYFLQPEDPNDHITKLNLPVTVLPLGAEIPAATWQQTPYSDYINPGPNVQTVVRMAATPYVPTNAEDFVARYRFTKQVTGSQQVDIVDVDSPNWTDTSAIEGQQVTYTVAYILYNPTTQATSDPGPVATSTITVTPPDRNPPIPSANQDPQYPYKAQFASAPATQKTPGGLFYTIVEAVEAIDLESAVQTDVDYRFVCSDSRYSSGGQEDDGPVWRNTANTAGLTYPDGNGQVPYRYTVYTGAINKPDLIWYIFYRDQSPNKNVGDSSDGWSANGPNPVVVVNP